jgi:hypothetical protein
MTLTRSLASLPVRGVAKEEMEDLRTESHNVNVIVFDDLELRFL